MRTDSFRDEKDFQADVASAIQSSETLDDTIRCLYAKGYRLLFIYSGLKGKVNEEPIMLKRRIERVTNEIIAEQNKLIKNN
jgi:hypothetical protein